MTSGNASTQAAIEALQRGYTAIPIRDGGKRPFLSAWTHTRWENTDEVQLAFDKFLSEGASGVGLLLGQPSGGLVDIDLDHPKAIRLRDYFLPPTQMETGRAGRSRSHAWYRVLDELPATRRFKMPDGAVSVELRSTGSQTVIPPSIHPSGEAYRWEKAPWGGEEGPEIVPGKKLAIQVALLGLGAVLLDNWPAAGSRHEAYLALAGGLLRYGDRVNPFWEKNLPILISSLALATRDRDGPEQRIAEVMGTTLTALRENGKVTGFPSLANIIGNDHAEQARRMAKEVTGVGWNPDAGKPATATSSTRTATVAPEETFEHSLKPEKRNPLTERATSWSTIDLGPYISGEVVQEPPTILLRTDGKGLMYPGLVNLIYGKSESAKSWIALYACVQVMETGGRVVYIDLEDGPPGTIARLLALGVGADDIANQFQYILPDSPLAAMQKSMFGGDAATNEGKASQNEFDLMLKDIDPAMIVVDGMTVLYGIHGHNTNDATATAFITNWLKSLCINGATVIVIDHTGKGDGAGASPIGAHHKIAMVQGTALRVDVISKPMKGAIGTIQLITYKDRPGDVRPISSKPPGGGEQVAGVITLDSSVEGISRMWIDPPDPDDVVIGNSDAANKALGKLAEAADLAEKIIDLFEDDPHRLIKSSEARKTLGYPESKRKLVYDAFSLLETTGRVIKSGATNSVVYRLASDVAQ